ncbi:hypothetical protein EI42_02564 [Thermosporothrix hazakensis]|jgi:plastocyanin|uniref:Blue (type 1) copper domain-containing protein n=1 Tax=Thermosporothrix hazakensis TaxID=644383 RepID=A0A326U987_THEHA|nr:hypothetical protein [Thermosporothrix hazakensis]PZW30592.1 hypothetical protein EI42_02564 [Thermosporothrix hazakensis]GCE49454.1 hypothetical protein KTH_43230 [Thermosporothrix hazakensis]
MAILGQAAVGFIVLLVVTGGLLYILYSRTNAVQKTGYGSLIMLAIVSMMIPVFWIMQNQKQAEAQHKLQAYAIEQGLNTYVKVCTDQCYAIDKDNKLIFTRYLGYDIKELNQMADDKLKSIISAGSYNPKAPHQPANFNAVPRRDTFGGQLRAIDVDYLFALIRSDDPAYVKKEGWTGEAAHSGFDQLVDYLQANSPSLYNQAVTLGKNGQFGEAVDKTNEKELTIHIKGPGSVQVCTSASGCFEYANVKVKVGTKITWVNEDKVIHTATAIDPSNLAQPTKLANGFDSGNLTTGQSFSWTVTEEAYNLDKENHRVVYYCSVHPDMQAQLVIVK